jgi:hypothetical protein
MDGGTSGPAAHATLMSAACQMRAEIAAGQDAFAGQGCWVIGLEIRYGLAGLFARLAWCSRL